MLLTSVGVRIENKQPPLIEGGRTSIKEALTAGAREAYKQSKMDPQLIVVILPVSDNIRLVEVAKLTGPRERILSCIRRSSTLPVSCWLFRSSFVAADITAMQLKAVRYSPFCAHCSDTRTAHRNPVPRGAEAQERPRS